MIRLPSTIRSVIVGSAIGLFSAIAAAQMPPSYGQDISLEQAKKAIALATGEARRNRFNMAIAIVDRHGLLVSFDRLDDTQTASVRIAIEKAQSAATFRRSTRIFNEAVNTGNPALLGLPGATPITGGLPVIVDGKVVGGIGVSGGTGDQDEQVARAGLGQ